MQTRRNPRATQWDIQAVATFLEVTASTARSMRTRGILPPPDGMTGRSPWWRAATIKTWHEGRRGRGRWRAEQPETD